MDWMSVKLPDNFQIREHSRPCLFHITYKIKQNKQNIPRVFNGPFTHSRLDSKIARFHTFFYIRVISLRTDKMVPRRSINLSKIFSKLFEI